MSTTTTRKTIKGSDAKAKEPDAAPPPEGKGKAKEPESAPSPTAKESAPSPTAKEPAPSPTAKEPAPSPTAKGPAPSPTAKGPAPSPTAKEPAPPLEPNPQAPSPAIATRKTLGNSTVSQAKENVSDLKVVGDGDMFQLLCKASSAAEGWMKSTKAMEIAGVGCIVQVTTQQGDNVAEAVTFVPNTRILPDENGGRRLVRAS